MTLTVPNVSVTLSTIPLLSIWAVSEQGDCRHGLVRAQVQNLQITCAISLFLSSSITLQLGSSLLNNITLIISVRKMLFACKLYVLQFCFHYQWPRTSWPLAPLVPDSVAEVQFSPVLPPFFENWEPNWQIFFRTEQNQNRTGSNRWTARNFESCALHKFYTLKLIARCNSCLNFFVWTLFEGTCARKHEIDKELPYLVMTNHSKLRKPCQ